MIPNMIRKVVYRASDPDPDPESGSGQIRKFCQIRIRIRSFEVRIPDLQNTKFSANLHAFFYDIPVQLRFFFEYVLSVLLKVKFNFSPLFKQLL